MDSNLVIYYNEQMSGGSKLKILDDLKHIFIWCYFLLLMLKTGCLAVMMTNFVKGIEMDYSVWPNSFNMDNFKS